MTDPTMVEATQGDREAAEALAMSLFDGDYDPTSIARTFSQAFARYRIAAEAREGARVEALDPDGYLWKWVERGLFDANITARQALEMLAHHPSAPWTSERWDVDHKPYAAKFYATFPKAVLSADGAGR